MDRFNEMQDQAKGYGIRSVVVLIEDDPLSGTEATNVNYVGVGPTLMMGVGATLMEMAKDE